MANARASEGVSPAVEPPAASYSDVDGDGGPPLPNGSSSPYTAWLGQDFRLLTAQIAPTIGDYISPESDYFVAGSVEERGGRVNAASVHMSEEWEGILSGIPPRAC